MTKDAKKPKKSFAKQKTGSSKSHFYGIHAINALLTHRPMDALALFAQQSDTNNDNVEQIIRSAKAVGVSVQYSQKERLTELCGSPQHQGVVLMSRNQTLGDERALDKLITKDNVLLLILDQITDAHNLGACLRTACAMGVDAVILLKNHSASISPTVAKVSVGASEVIPVIAVTNLARTLTDIKSKGVFVFGTALDETATPSCMCDFGAKVAIVMGSEGSGMRRLTREQCDTLVYIAMADTPHRPQSLNVSVATGMILYEVLRQRKAAAIH